MKSVRGVFTIELAMVLVFVSSLFAMQVNSAIAIANKGKIQRVSYSLATMLAERKQLFGDEGAMCATEEKCQKAMDVMFDIAKASLNRMSGNFDPSSVGIQIEELRKENSNVIYTKRVDGNIEGCTIVGISNDAHLLPKTSKSRFLPLYQVSLCYKTPLNVLGIGKGELLHLTSSSISYARI